MAAPAPDRKERLDSLRALLRERFPGADRLDLPEYGVLPSGIAVLDELLPGGLPRGALTLLSGALSSGKTGLALACVAAQLRQGGRAAWVHRGSLSAASAEHAGVDLERLLVVRVDGPDQSLRCIDFLLRWQAFGLVVLDFSARGGRGASWSRLQRLVAGSRAAFLVLSLPPGAGDPLPCSAGIHVGLQHSREAVELSLLKSRYPRRSDGSRLARTGMPGAPFELLADLPGLGQDGNDAC